MAQIKVLVADQNRDSRESLKQSLEAMDYQVLTANDGAAACARCKETHPDIALVDTRMPKLDAFELLAYIQSYSRKTAVVVLTAGGTVAQAVEAMKLGAADFIEKPADPKTIQLLCREILLRRKLAAGGSVDDFLGLAELARRRNARLERRIYLKTAMVSDVTRPEPYYELGKLHESEGNARQAAHYYYTALDARSMFQPAREALARLGYLDAGPVRQPAPGRAGQSVFLSNIRKTQML